MKSHQEITDRLAQYRYHTIHIPAANGKMLTEAILKHWEELKTDLIRYKGFILNAEIEHEFKRKDMPHDPKGESFVKYLEYNLYTLKQDDFDLRFNNTSSYGFYTTAPTLINFSLDYYHSGEHQFGIYATFSEPGNLCRELELRSMDHSEAELISLGNRLLKVLEEGAAS
ncbi:MAG: hypothetical protein H6582_08285 [Crocinitomicaceae bacterium]|nr:hypothetical protein [Crocinitomicaceae bacterium]